MPTPVATTRAAHGNRPTTPLNITPITRLCLNVAPPQPPADILQAIPATNASLNHARNATPCKAHVADPLPLVNIALPTRFVANILQAIPSADLRSLVVIVSFQLVSIYFYVIWYQ
jgi:hypothetical protein